MKTVTYSARVSEDGDGGSRGGAATIEILSAKELDGDRYSHYSSDVNRSLHILLQNQ